MLDYLIRDAKVIKNATKNKLCNIILRFYK